jgi:hypothetical protein
VQASANYQQVNNDLNLIELLQLIRTSMYTGATSKDIADSLIDVMEQFHSFNQSGCTANATYLPMFQSHIKAIDNLDGGFGIHMPYIEIRIKNASGDPDDVAVWTQAKDKVCAEFVAKYFLLKSDDKRWIFGGFHPEQLHIQTG